MSRNPRQRASPENEGSNGSRSAGAKRSRTRLLVVCAVPEYRKRLASLAKELSFPLVVTEARDVKEARRSCLNKPADVILLDLSLPFADGLTMMHVLRDKTPWARVVLLASSSKDIPLGGALRVGARGVLHRTATLEELAGCLQPLLGGRTSNEHEPEAQRKPVLTKRELEILQLIDSRLKNKDIGERLSITEGTVKIHVHAILAKLGANSRREAISKARDYGFMAALPILGNPIHGTR
jgi:two-component system, NarL family, nitrate/nitrite response regulator NarL